jgi:GTP-binding protein HflX
VPGYLSQRHPVLTVLKIDLLVDPEAAQGALDEFPSSTAISALTGRGIQEMLSLVNEYLYEKYIPVTVRLPHQEGALIAAFHNQGQVERVEQSSSGVLLQGRLPGRLLAQYQAFILDEEEY